MKTDKLKLFLINKNKLLVRLTILIAITLCNHTIQANFGGLSNVGEVITPTEDSEEDGNSGDAKVPTETTKTIDINGKKYNLNSAGLAVDPDDQSILYDPHTKLPIVTIDGKNFAYDKNTGKYYQPLTNGRKEVDSKGRLLSNPLGGSSSGEGAGGTDRQPKEDGAESPQDDESAKAENTLDAEDSGPINGDNEVPKGSSLFRNCHKALPQEKTWEYLISASKSGDVSGVWNPLFGTYNQKFKSAYSKLDKTNEGTTEFNDKVRKIADNIVTKLNKSVMLAIKCTALATMIDELNDDTEDTAQMMVNPMMMAMSGTTGSATGGSMGATGGMNSMGMNPMMMGGMMGGNPGCKVVGQETQDFKPCKRLVNAYNASIFAKMAVDTGQQVAYKKQASDSMATLSKKDDPTAALTAQKDGVKTQSNMAAVKAAFHAANFAMIAGLREAIPSSKKLLKKCENDLSTDSINTIVTNASSKNSVALEKLQLSEGGITHPNDPSEICTSVLGESSSFLLANQEIRDIAKQIMMMDGTQAATMGTTAGLLADQAKKIDETIDEVKKYKPTDPTLTDAQVAECQLNPTKCLQQNAQQIGFDGGGVQIGGSMYGTSSSAGSANGGPLGQAATGSSSTTDPNSVASGIGTVTGQAIKSNSFTDAKTAAGKIKAGGGKKGGGGGGGGKKGGGGGGGGSAPSGGGQQKGGNTSSGPSVSTKYSSGSGSGVLSYGLGKSYKRKKKSKSKNPFSGLFGKKGKKGGSEVLNYRGVASEDEIAPAEGKNIFDMISGRYQKVHSTGNLLIYNVIDEDNEQ